jgi:hypothetical protein
VLKQEYIQWMLFLDLAHMVLVHVEDSMDMPSVGTAYRMKDSWQVELAEGESDIELVLTSDRVVVVGMNVLVVEVVQVEQKNEEPDSLDLVDIDFQSQDWNEVVGQDNLDH